MPRLRQSVLIVATMLLSWTAMQAVHELGHVLGAWCSGGVISRVVLHPLTISRTDLVCNPRPLFVAWAGPATGALLPLALWGLAVGLRCPWHYLFRFFAGFCLIANGSYIAAGSVAGIGDAGDMLRSGSPPWLLWVFGAVTFPVGLWLWHDLGRFFGLGAAGGQVSGGAAWCCTIVLLTFLAIQFLVLGVRPPC